MHNIVYFLLPLPIQYKEIAWEKREKMLQDLQDTGALTLVP